MSEYFGFKPDDNGDLNFFTVSTNWEVNNYEDYQELFKYLMELAQPGVMPILVFTDEQD